MTASSLPSVTVVSVKLSPDTLSHWREVIRRYHETYPPASPQDPDDDAKLVLLCAFRGAADYELAATGGRT